MKIPRSGAVLTVLLLVSGIALASAYNAQPKLVVVVIVDQFPAYYLERAHDQLLPAGFRLLTERGAYFADCQYDYASTETAPGHATLFTGAYTDAHGILSDMWWDPARKRMVMSVFDDTTRQVGTDGTGASPRNLLTDTLGDELRLATDGKARVFALSLKDRSAIFSAGFAGNGVYWIDHKSGAWVSSTFYMQQLPAWVQQFNASGKADQYWNREWKDEHGNVLGKTTRGPAPSFYHTVAATPFANDYQLDFARQLIVHEKLGEGPATDLLAISLSSPDFLGHDLGPNSPEMKAMVLALDRQLADFFSFLGQRFGLANVWIALSSDHGVSPVPKYAQHFRLPAETLNPRKLEGDLNAAIAARVHRAGNYLEGQDGVYYFASEAAFDAAGVKNEAEAERAFGDALVQVGAARSYVTRAQLSVGNVPNDASGRQLLHSYSPLGGWYVVAIPPPFTFPWTSTAGTTHGSWFTYDRHVPLAFFGLPFQAGVHRGRCEPVDMAVTLASLLGISAPVRATGRVLTEALRPREGPR